MNIQKHRSPLELWGMSIQRTRELYSMATEETMVGPGVQVFSECSFCEAHIKCVLYNYLVLNNTGRTEKCAECPSL